MDNRQWVVTTALGGLFASAFLYLPIVGNFWVFIAVSILQGTYLGWQNVTPSQSRLGVLSFALGLFVGAGLMGVLLTRFGPDVLWGLSALFGIISGVVAMVATRLVRNARQ